MKGKLFVLGIVLCLLLCGCGTDAPVETASTEGNITTNETLTSETPPVDTVTPEVIPSETEIPEVPVAKVVAVHMVYGEDTMVSAIVTGLDDNGEELWAYTTSSGYAAQLDNIVGMELRDNLYYLVENGTVTALSAADGSVVWQNGDFIGSPAMECWAFDEAGNLYIAGYLGPDLMVISPEGETLTRIGSFSLEYFWPYELWLEGDAVCLAMEGTPAMDGGTATLRVELEEGSYDILSCTVDGQEVEPVRTAAATSYLVEPNVIHEPIRAFDGDPDTAWVEGVEGVGVGESVTLLLGKTTTVSGFTILPGYQKSESLYEKNGRPTALTLEFSDGTSRSFRLSDGMGEQRFTFDVPAKTNFVTVVIDEAVSGSEYEDTCISEITLH